MAVGFCWLTTLASDFLPPDDSMLMPSTIVGNATTNMTKQEHIQPAPSGRFFSIMTVIKLESARQMAFFHLVSRMRAAIQSYDEDPEKATTHERFAWWSENLQAERVS